MRNFLREQGVQLDPGFPSTTSLKDILHVTPICTPRVALRAQRRTGSPASGLSRQIDLLANTANGIGSINSRLSALENKVNKIDGQPTSVVDNQLGPNASRGQQKDHWSPRRSENVRNDPTQEREPPYGTTHSNTLQRTYDLLSQIGSAFNHPSQPHPSVPAFSQPALHTISPDHHHFAPPPPQHYPVHNPSIPNCRRFGMPPTRRRPSPLDQGAPHCPQGNPHRNIGRNSQPIVPNTVPADLPPYSSPHAISALENYSSVGHISRLLQGRPGNSSGQTAYLIKIYSSPTQQFHGDGSIKESLASTHQIYINKCLSLTLTEDEARDNLYCIFAPYSTASNFYSKHVQSQARTLDEAFYLLYNRFMSEDRREILTKLWNNMKLDQLKSNNKDLKTAFMKLCRTDEFVQLQLGRDYQAPSLLRDTVSRAVEQEKWSILFAMADTSDYLKLQKACLKAMGAFDQQGMMTAASTNTTSSSTRLSVNQLLPATAAKPIAASQPASTLAPNPPAPSLVSSAASSAQATSRLAPKLPYSEVFPKSFPAHAHEINYQSKERKVLAYRQYGVNSKKKAVSSANNNHKSGRTNPLDNFGNVLRCRNCSSAYHFIRDCDKLGLAELAHYIEAILLTESESISDLDLILDRLQNCDDAACDTFKVSVQQKVMENDECDDNEQDEPSAASSLFFTLSQASTEPIPTVDLSNSQGFDQLFDNDILYGDGPELLGPALQQAPVLWVTNST